MHSVRNAKGVAVVFLPSDTNINYELQITSFKLTIIR